MDNSVDEHSIKRSRCRRVMNTFSSVSALRIALTILFVTALILLGAAQKILIFSSPVIHLMNIEASRIIGAKVSLFPAWYNVDVAIIGANASAQVDMSLWEVMLRVNVDIPYGFAPQNITQLYRVQDIPCAEFRDLWKKMQVFSLLSLFSGIIVLVFTISNFFTRMFLPLLWFFLWISIIFTASTIAMMMHVLCDGACYGEATAIPPFVSLAEPTGGFVLVMICLQTYLITSIMSVFL